MKNPLDLVRRRDRVTVVRLEGVIGAGPRFGAPALTDAGLAPLIEAAFRRGRPKAVALAINSPGGSAAQSSLIAARIRRLADEKKVPVHAFVEDVAASGGYWLATAADQIHLDAEQHRRLDRGDLGLVRLPGLDRAVRHRAAGAYRRRGQEHARPLPARAAGGRRAAEAAAGADPRSNFIAQVRTRRGERLQAEDLFTGEFWVGQKGVDLGLADGIGHLVPVMRGSTARRCASR